jgi:hypothetical protein
MIEPDSECASLVQYDGQGGLAVTFIKGGQTYVFDVDAQTAREAKRACNSAQFGEWFNQS